MFEPSAWTQATVTHRTEWDDGLFTFQTDVRRPFKAGQFTKLGLMVEGESVSRAYSIASAPGDPLEFYVVAVQGGRLSPRLAALSEGDSVWMSPRIVGGFIAEKVPDGGDLWMIGTGTGLAPYIAMLRQGTVFDRFDRVVVVQGSRWRRQLGYTDELLALAASGRIRYLRTITREDADDCVRGRITTLYESGALEELADLPLSAERSHVMMCGNPAMIKEMTARFKERDMRLHTPRRAGNVHVERYW